MLKKVIFKSDDLFTFSGGIPQDSRKMCEFFQKGFELNFYLEKKTFVFNHILLNIEKYLDNVCDNKKNIFINFLFEVYLRYLFQKNLIEKKDYENFLLKSFKKKIKFDYTDIFSKIKVSKDINIPKFLISNRLKKIKTSYDEALFLTKPLPIMAQNNKTIVRVHDLVPILFTETLREPSFLNRLYFKKLIHFHCLNSYILANSTYTKEIIEENFKTKFPVKVFNCQPNISKDKILNKNQNQICWINTFEPRKNLDFLILIIDEILKKTNYNFKLIGHHGWQNKNFFSQIKQLRSIYPNRLTIDIDTGYKFVEKVIKQSKLCLMTSIEEGFGISIVDSLFADTQVLAPNLRWSKKIYDKSINYYENNDLDSCSKEIQNIMNNKKSSGIKDYNNIQLSYEEIKSWIN